MFVKRLYMNNPLRNYNYIVACPDTRQALILDPFDADACLRVARENDLEVVMVINSHEHWDHIQGNDEVVKQTGAQVMAHANAKGKIPNVDRFLSGGEIIELGSSIKFRVLNTPGHTFAHLSLLEDSHKALFSGDILFNACAGNCFNGGDVGKMYETFRDEIAAIPDDVMLYPGHDYIETNLRFSLRREPGNVDAKKLLEQVEVQTPDTRLQTNLGTERLVNPFLRLQQSAIRAGLSNEFSIDIEDDRSTFVHLRQLRDQW